MISQYHKELTRFTEDNFYNIEASLADYLVKTGKEAAATNEKDKVMDYKAYTLFGDFEFEEVALEAIERMEGTKRSQIQGASSGRFGKAVSVLFDNSKVSRTLISDRQKIKSGQLASSGDMSSESETTPTSNVLQLDRSQDPELARHNNIKRRMIMKRRLDATGMSGVETIVERDHVVSGQDRAEYLDNIDYEVDTNQKRILVEDEYSFIKLMELKQKNFSEDKSMTVSSAQGTETDNLDIPDVAVEEHFQSINIVASDDDEDAEEAHVVTFVYDARYQHKEMEHNRQLKSQEDVDYDKIDSFHSANGNLPTSLSDVAQMDSDESIKLYRSGGSHFIVLTADEAEEGQNYRRTVIKQVSSSQYKAYERLKQQGRFDKVVVTSQFAVVEAESIDAAHERVSEDAKVGFGSLILGDSVVEAGAELDGFVMLENAHLNSGSKVGNNSSLINSRINGTVLLGANSSVQDTSISSGDLIAAKGGVRLNNVQASTDVLLGQGVQLKNIMDVDNVLGQLEKATDDFISLEGSFGLLGNYKIKDPKLVASNVDVVSLDNKNFLKNIWERIKAAFIKFKATMNSIESDQRGYGKYFAPVIKLFKAIFGGISAFFNHYRNKAIENFNHELMRNLGIETEANEKWAVFLQRFSDTIQDVWGTSVDDEYREANHLVQELKRRGEVLSEQELESKKEAIQEALAKLNGSRSDLKRLSGMMLFAKENRELFKTDTYLSNEAVYDEQFGKAQ